MKLSINRAELADALSITCNVVPARTPKPILQCVLFSVRKDMVVLSATDLDIGVRCSIGQVEVDKVGTLLLAADKFNQIVHELSDEVLVLEIQDNICHIRGSDSHFQIYTQESKGYPPVPDLEGTADFEVGMTALRSLTDWTVFAAARENTRYAINGVLWERKNEELILVATDGRRLSRAVHRVGKKAGDQRAIVPTKAMQLFGRVVGDADASVGIKIGTSQIILKTAGTTISATLLEGHFPKYEDVIPDDCNKKVEFDSQGLLSAVRQAALLTNDESKGVKLSFEPGVLTLSSRAPEQGEASITVPINYNHEKVEIGFNPVFLMDVLRAVHTEKVSFEFSTPNRPGLFRVGDAQLYVVMPVNLS